MSGVCVVSPAMAGVGVSRSTLLAVLRRRGRMVSMLVMSMLVMSMLVMSVMFWVSHHSWT